MNDVAEPSDPSGALPVNVELRIAEEKTSWIDRVADTCSDWLSPILVKETRQALKSRQFFWTFFLLLAAIAIWTMTGLTAYSSRQPYGYSGPVLLAGYWMILGFPLTVVIPFGAYRSLAREYEDGTIQLISVTTMKAWQVVVGKLGSSLLQMLIYYSVLAPCIAFTYLLKGISIPQIFFGLTIISCVCFTLCSVALLMAGATRSVFYGVASTILLIVIQLGCYYAWSVLAYNLAMGEVDELTRSEGEFVFYGLLLALLTTGMLFLTVAAGLISFEADNRSTLARIMMLVQQTAFLGFCLTIFCFRVFAEAPVVFTWIVAHYWLIMGCFMIGERTKLSSRVSRSVPTTVLNRSLFSFFLPGSGRGLIFATLNIWICGIVILLAAMNADTWFPNTDNTAMGSVLRNSWPAAATGRIVTGVVSVCLYPTSYLALTYLICLSLRFASGQKVGPAISFLVGLIVVLFSVGTSMFCHFNFLPPYETDEYSNFQIFNWYWTTIELTDNRFTNVDLLVATCFGWVMAFFCLVAYVCASFELLQKKAAIPKRVQEEIELRNKLEQLEPGDSIEEILAPEEGPS